MVKGTNVFNTCGPPRRGRLFCWLLASKGICFCFAGLGWKYDSKNMAQNGCGPTLPFFSKHLYRKKPLIRISPKTPSLNPLKRIFHDFPRRVFAWKKVPETPGSSLHPLLSSHEAGDAVRASQGDLRLWQSTAEDVLCRGVPSFILFGIPFHV